jgi:hypothetical protein
MILLSDNVGFDTFLVFWYRDKMIKVEVGL